MNAFIITFEQIKVRFPDRVTLQGYVHPRHSAEDVVRWVQECLSVPEEAAAFELYSSPPRTVVATSDSSLRMDNKKLRAGQGAQEEGEKTLADLGFVPAALLHLAWKKEASAAVSKASGSGEGVELGSYLQEYLLREFSSSWKSASHDYPTGESLVVKTTGSESAPSKAFSSESGPNISDSTIEKKDKKPKWFKM